MKSAALIKKYIEDLPDGKSFTSSELRTFATTENIRQILNRLVRAGKIKRVARGIYAKPKQSELFGEILPNSFEIAKSLSELTGETIMIHGAEAARILHLTTQVPMQVIFYTSGNTRVLRLNNIKVKLKHVNPSRLIAAGTIPGLVICALNFVGQKNITIDLINKIRSVISEQDFIQTIQLISKMPAWMADIFYQYSNKYKNEK